MFLNKLNEKEKESFLSLAHHIANCDDNFSQEEQKMISAYCREMTIIDIDYDEGCFDLDNTLNNFETLQSQKIILIELFALVFSDGHHLHDEEVNVIEAVAQKFNIDTNLINVFANWSKSIIALINQGKSLILL